MDYGTLNSKTWTLQTLHETSCAEIPSDTGVYFVLVPDGMKIQFTTQVQNHHAPFYEESMLVAKINKFCISEKPVERKAFASEFGSI